MSEHLKNLAIWLIAISLFATIFLILKADYDEYVASDNHTCVYAYRNAGWAHIRFKSENHHYNWCDAHPLDWYELSNGRVQAEADKLRKAKGWKPSK